MKYVIQYQTDEGKKLRLYSIANKGGVTHIDKASRFDGLSTNLILRLLRNQGIPCEPIRVEEPPNAHLLQGLMQIMRLTKDEIMILSNLSTSMDAVDAAKAIVHARNIIESV